MVRSSWVSLLVIVVVAPLLMSASVVRDSSDVEDQFLRVPASMRHRLLSVSRPSVNQRKEVDVKIKEARKIKCYRCTSYPSFYYDEDCYDPGYEGEGLLYEPKQDRCCFVRIKNDNVERGTGTGCESHVDGDCNYEDDGQITCYCTDDECNDKNCGHCKGPSTSPSTEPSTDPSTYTPTEPPTTPPTPPTTDPSTSPSTEPSTDPSTYTPTEPPTTPPTPPTTDPSTSPSTEPSTDPSTYTPTEPPTTPPTPPTTDHSTEPSTDSSTYPSTDPSTSPSTEPSTDPSTYPPTEPPTTPPTPPTTDQDLFEETKVTLDSIQNSYSDLLDLTASLMGTTESPEITTPTTITEVTSTAAHMNVMFDLELTTDAVCHDMCQNITATMDRIQSITNGISKWTHEVNKLTDLNHESNILNFQVEDAKLDPEFKDDAGYVHDVVADKNKALDETINEVEKKIEDIKDQNTNSIILISVIASVGGLIIIALVGTSIYAFISKGKKDRKIGLDGPAADIAMKELDKPEAQEPSNAPAYDAPKESQPLNPYAMNPLREPAADMKRTPSAREPYSAQPARTSPREIECSANTRGAYSDQPQRYPPRNLERSTSSRDPYAPSEPRGLNRNQDPFVHQSPKKQPPVVPRKPQGSGRPNPYNGQQHSPRSRLESSDSNGYGIPRATPDPRIPRGRPVPHDERPRGGGQYRDPHSQAPQRGGSRPANPSNYY